MQHHTTDGAATGAGGPGQADDAVEPGQVAVLDPAEVDADLAVTLGGCPPRKKAEVGRLAEIPGDAQLGWASAGADPQRFIVSHPAPVSSRSEARVP